MKRKTTSAQLRIGESIAVLFIFMLMVAFGLVFYFNAQKSSIIRKFESDRADRIVEIVLRLSAMPELQCPSHYHTRNCVDIHMLKALKDEINENKDLKNNYYYDLFLTSKIIVEIIRKPDGLISPSADPDDHTWTLYDKSVSAPPYESYHESIPVIIYNSTGTDGENRQGEFYFGQINVTYTYGV